MRSSPGDQCPLLGQRWPAVAKSLARPPDCLPPMAFGSTTKIQYFVKGFIQTRQLLPNTLTVGTAPLPLSPKGPHPVSSLGLPIPSHQMWAVLCLGPDTPSHLG